ncbi:MAG: histidine phosphatase family protein [Actinomycetia bacterium]|nr:histidine phosphatase family protein [Actinomycetes bacterium]
MPERESRPESLPGGPVPPGAPPGAPSGAPPDGGSQPEPHPGATAYRQSRFRLPPGATDILVIRHGESEAAYMDRPFPLRDGHADPELSENGREQAERLAERLAKAPIDAIYVTSLRRTMQTAAPLAERLGLTPQVEPDLREVHLGEWEAGRFRKMVADNHPIAERMWAEERWDVIPGAEPAEVFAARTGGAIKRIAAAHPDQRVAVVVHGGVIAVLLAMASGSRPFAFLGADNASISRLVITPERWILRLYNDTAHLEP